MTAKRVVLAYSGGLDTSVAVKWIQKGDIEEIKEVIENKRGQVRFSMGSGKQGWYFSQHGTKNSMFGRGLCVSYPYFGR